MIYNSTSVIATWNVINVSEAGGVHRSSGLQVDGFERKLPPVDDSSVFEIDPKSGRLGGPNVQVWGCKSYRSAEVRVKFFPKSNTRYSTRIRFSCQYGNAFEVLLEGEGTFDEHEHKPLSPVSFN